MYEAHVSNKAANLIGVEYLEGITRIVIIYLKSYVIEES